MQPCGIIYVKDKGLQIPIRLAKFCIYAGPPSMFWLLMNFHEDVYIFLCTHLLDDQVYLKNSQEDMILWEPGTVEQMAFWMITIHFSKLYFESVFLQRFSGRMVSYKTVLWDMFLYWGILGLFVGFSIYHTQYMPSIFFADLD